MPYIKHRDRTDLTRLQAMNPGELNYAVTQTCLEYLWRKGLSYSALNEVIGALECAKLELYRRGAAPYEDKKIEENGDLPLYERLLKK